MLLMRALQDAGVPVPERIALVGADDLLLGRLLRPRLSTVHMSLPPGDELADLVDRLVTVGGPAPVTGNLLEVTLVPRDSS